MEVDGERRRVGRGRRDPDPAGRLAPDHGRPPTPLRFLCCCAPPYSHDDTLLRLARSGTRRVPVALKLATAGSPTREAEALERGRRHLRRQRPDAYARAVPDAGRSTTTGARTWFSAESVGASRASDTSHGWTTTPTRPLPSAVDQTTPPPSSTTSTSPSGAAARHAGEEVPAAEAGDERVRGRVHELLRRARLDELPLEEDADAVGERGRVLEVVRDEERRQAHLAQDLLELDADGLARVRVQGGERLVEEQDARVARERPGERDALALAARQLARPRRGEVRDAGSARAARRRASRPPKPTLRRDGEVREERVVLEHVADRPLLGGRSTPRPASSHVSPPSRHGPLLRPQQPRHGPQDASTSRRPTARRARPSRPRPRALSSRRKARRGWRRSRRSASTRGRP